MSSAKNEFLSQVKTTFASQYRTRTFEKWVLKIAINMCHCQGDDFK